MSSVGGVDLALARGCAACAAPLAVVIVFSVKASGSVPLYSTLQDTAAWLWTGVQAWGGWYI